MHRYGPHIFHTNSREISDYLSRFTAWRPYEHRVLAQVDGQLVRPDQPDHAQPPLRHPAHTADEVEAFLAAARRAGDADPHVEDVVVGRVGRELYEKFFRGYTRKQWGLDPSQLDKSVTARVPTRTNRDDRYFSDATRHAAHGYTRMFENMLDHPNIKIMLNTDYRGDSRTRSLTTG